MNKRGRPPHPDILTPREWEVLGLIREELSNEEIAGRLGISIDGVKYHVSEILSKLGVGSREDLAAHSLDILPVGGAVDLGSGLYGGSDWSSDGRSIAFIRNGTLYRADAPEFKPYILVQPPGDGEGPSTDPRWSLDGTRIAFTGWHQGRGDDPTISTGTIWIVGADGSGLQDLLPGEKAVLSTSTVKVMQDWLDNRTLAFDEHCGTACQSPRLLDVETGNVRQVIEGESDTGPPGAPGTVYHYSPDQRWIAVDALGTTPQVVLFDRQTSTLTYLLPDVTPPPWQWFTSWAPDSSAFLYHQAHGDGSRFMPPFNLRRYDIETRED